MLLIFSFDLKKKVIAKRLLLVRPTRSFFKKRLQPICFPVNFRKAICEIPPGDYFWHSTTAWNVFKYGVFFWSVFSRIQAEYGKIEVSLRIQSECRKILTRKNSVFGHFNAVFLTIRHHLFLEFWLVDTWIFAH